MKQNFFKLWQNTQIKKILTNTFSLVILKGSNYIFPLVLLPYLIRVLGVEGFGLLAFATATVNMLRGFVSYGFDLSGTQLISRNYNKKEKLIKIFNSILIVKFLLALCLFIFLLSLVFFVDKLHLHWEIFILTALLMFTDVLFPIWFFQGMEKMKIITYLKISHKSLFVLLILIFVNNQNDIFLVPLLDAIGAFIVGIIALKIVREDFNMVFKKQKYIQIIFQLKYGWHVFLSKIAVILYTSLNTFVLGLLTNNESVGYYSLAEKIYMAIRGLYSPFIQALFPYLSKLYLKNQSKYFLLVKKITIGYFLSLVLISCLLYSFSSEIVYLISGKNIINTINILNILSISVVFSIGSLYSIFLIIKNQGKILSKITFISMLFNVLFVYPLISLYGIYGLAYLFLSVQIFQTLLQLKYNKEIFLKR